MSRTAERQLPIENLGPGTPTPEVRREEIIKIPEKWNIDAGGMTISGPAGVGTTSLARSLAEITGARLITVGQIIRERAGETSRAPGFVERDPKVDADVDEEVRQLVIKADKTNPFIAEAQIGGFSALDIQRQMEAEGISIEENPVIRILLTARKEVRDERMYKASRAKGEINEETGKPYTRDEIRRNNSNRAKADIAWWKKLYPDRIGEDHPHHLGARDAQGRKIYHLEFDNSDHTTPEQTLLEVLGALRELGLITPIEEQMEPNKPIYLPTLGDKVKSWFRPGDKRKLAN